MKACASPASRDGNQVGNKKVRNRHGSHAGVVSFSVSGGDRRVVKQEIDPKRRRARPIGAQEETAVLSRDKGTPRNYAGVASQPPPRSRQLRRKAAT